MPADLMSWISFFLAILGIILAVWALILQFTDRPRLEVLSIRPGISSRRTTGQQWEHRVSSIEIVVENRGPRPAIGCAGAISFPLLEGLPLHPQTREYTVDTSTRAFNIEAESRIRLVAAWHFTGGGAIDGTKADLTPGDFLQKCVPSTVTITHGTKRIQSVLSVEDARRIFEDHQMNIYLGPSIE